MPNMWVISDTHFGHKNFLSFLDDDGNRIRPFDSVDELDELMVERWNDVVKPQDKVYHLGDVFFGDKDHFNKLWARLNGKKRLIVGNHDDIRYLSGKNPINDQWYFEKVDLWRVWRDERMLFSHIPLNPDNTWLFLAPDESEEGDCGPARVPMLNVHGHIHQNASPEGAYLNVSVEVTDYRPVNVETIVDKVRKMV